MIKNIFGKSVKFIFEDERVAKTLSNELALYMDSPHSNIDVEVIFVKKMINIKYQYISPAIHTTTHNGFLAHYGSSKVFYIKKENVLKIYIEILKTSLLIKCISVDFNTALESVGTILHELVLVPMTYFYDDLTIVHASSFKNKNTNKVYLIGGTGGVGKTSLELLYCKKNNYSFISDDIAVVDNKGNVYPNLSFPKIYAYNVGSDKEFEKFVLSNDSIYGKFQWHFIKMLRGEKRVRRRLSATTLYGQVEQNSSNINNYNILARNNQQKDITKERIANIDDVVQNTLNIIKNEYHTFHQHIVWHEYNCLINNIKPIIRLEQSFATTKEILYSCFRNTENYYIKIPNNLKHSDFISNMESYIG